MTCRLLAVTKETGVSVFTGTSKSPSLGTFSNVENRGNHTRHAVCVSVNRLNFLVTLQ